jgi:AcrR family transcriptional regulator
MSPRSSFADAHRTRRRIVARAMRVAADEGFEAVSLGRLAGDLHMSKAGVAGPFGSVEELQLEAVAEAIETFTRAVWEPAAGEAAGLPRLLRIFDTWTEYLGGRSYVGGCFVSAEHHESRRLRASVARAMAGWLDVLAREVETAIADGDIDADADPRDIAFAINAIALGVGQSRRLGLDPQAAQRARRAMRRVIG